MKTLILLEDPHRDIFKHKRILHYFLYRHNTQPEEAYEGGARGVNLRRQWSLGKIL